MSFFPLKTREKTVTDTNEFLYKTRHNKLPNILKYFSERLITNEQMLDAKAGLYTWILRGSQNIYALKTLSKQEIGTLHANLKLLTDPYDSTPIEAAGELEIIKEESFAPPTVIFNLLSGTYMAKKFEKLSVKNTLIQRNELVRIVENKLMDLGIPSQFLECSTIECSDEEKIGGKKLIEDALIKTSNKKLEVLNTMFYRVKGGKTRRIRYSHRKTRRGSKK